MDLLGLKIKSTFKPGLPRCKRSFLLRALSGPLFYSGLHDFIKFQWWQRQEFIPNLGNGFGDEITPIPIEEESGFNQPEN